MPTGALTEYLDVAQVTLYAFWIFFAFLILYLRMEDKREGYPLESDRSSNRVKVVGFPPVPAPKTFLRKDGTTVQAPRDEPFDTDLPAKREWAGLGSPLVPTGDALTAKIGPGSACKRRDEPLRTWHDTLQTFPLRNAPDYSVSEHDFDPRGWSVHDHGGAPIGTVTDLWADEVQRFVRYVEFEMQAPEGVRQVLVPMFFSRFDQGRKRMRIDALSGDQVARAPCLKSPDQVTALEEEHINAFFTGGQLYATPRRAEPLL